MRPISLPSLESLTESIFSHSYTKLQVPRGSTNLLFSDIVPVASTNESAAAVAMYHLLALASKGLLKVEQNEAYGDVRSFLLLRHW